MALSLIFIEPFAIFMPKLRIRIINIHNMENKSFFSKKNILHAILQQNTH